MTFKKYKVAIFVDSEFWHGKDWETNKQHHKSNKEFWYKKIEKNIQRDKVVNEVLLKNGWEVLRFWGKEIDEELLTCISKIETKIHEVKRQNIN